MLTGNGRGEFYLLEVISQRLDGTSKVIAFPFFQSKDDIRAVLKQRRV
jgi:hypothetical protein